MTNFDPGLPVLVSYPRSGSNWLQAVMELYFNRHHSGKIPTSPSWLETPYENPMWAHNHDLGKKRVFTKQPVIFLWRNPIDVIYSRTEIQGGKINPGQLSAFAKDYQRLFNKWFNPTDREKSHGGGRVLIVCYETVLKSPHKEMHRISKFFGISFSLSRSKRAFKTVGDKKNTNERNGPDPDFKNQESHTLEYAKRREDFRKEWGKEILSLTKFPEELL